MRIRRITVQNILFFETISEFSVLSIHLFFLFCPLIDVNLLIFLNFCTKNLSAVRSPEVSALGRVNLIKKMPSSFGKIFCVRLWEVSAVGRVRL